MASLAYLRRVVARSNVRIVATMAILGICAANALAQTAPLPQFAVVHNFSTAEGSGARSTARLIQASNGMIYGVRQWRGTFDGGTLFRLNPDGTGFAVLRHFGATDGMGPTMIIPASDGRIYGATDSGASSRGTIFSVGLDGTGFNVVHRFTGSGQGWNPAALMEGADGRLYGTCLGVGGTNYDAAVLIFRVNRDGTGYTVLRSLVKATEGGGINGLASTWLVQGPDGRLYGTAGGGGASGCGTVFRLNTDGSGFSVLRSLTPTEGSSPNRLTITKSGKLFATTYAGGRDDQGAIFRMDLDGTNFAVVKSLVGNYPPPSASTRPWAGLTEAPDGMLYGASNGGGDLRDYGTLYRINPADGSYILLRSMSPADGLSVPADLLHATNGRLYGMSGVAGTLANGTVFSYSISTVISTATATLGQPFTFAAAPLFGSAPNFFADGLPGGLTINERTGEITGVPNQAGLFTVTLGVRATTPPPPVTLKIEIPKSAATVTLSNLTQAYDGKPRPATAVTVPAGLSLVVLYDGALTVPTRPGTYAVYATINDNTFAGVATGTLTIAASTPTITAQSENQTVIAGNTTTLTATVTASGPVTYQWQRKPAGGATFTDLSEGSSYTGVTSAQLSVAAPALTTNGDQFRVVVTNISGFITGEPIVLTVHASSVLTNVSVRARAVVGEPLTIGFVTTGSRPMLIRAIGPGLTPFLGAGTAIAGDPSLVVTNSANIRLAANDNWSGGAELVTAFTNAGAFALPGNSLDAALLTSVVGAATAQVSVTSTGLALTEVYDAGRDAAVRIANLSALYHVGRGEDALVAGFMISGTGTKALLIRGIGPGLRAFGVTNAIAAARIEIISASGASLATNDGWPERLGETFSQVGAFALPAGSRDAALVLNAPPGLYTIQLSSADDTTGHGLIEIYELP